MNRICLVAQDCHHRTAACGGKKTKQKPYSDVLAAVRWARGKADVKVLFICASYRAMESDPHGEVNVVQVKIHNRCLSKEI